jgi:hypothetical protein
MHDKHQRKQAGPAEWGETEFVWNGESALIAGMADLIDIWSIRRDSSKCPNAYLMGEGENKRTDSFKTLAETWNSDEFRNWNEHLSDFWGRIIHGPQTVKGRLQLKEISDMGADHRFLPKNGNASEDRERPEACLVSREETCLSRSIKQWSDF